MRSDPYCGNCGYSLQGLTESSKCPECGRPIVEVLTRDSPAFRAGRRYRSSIVLFGLPLVDVALGPHGDKPIGKARGIIAIGDVARGWFALGGVAVGIVAVGGMAVGIFALGGLAIGVLALGGCALGGAAIGGGATGGVVSAGGAAGIVAQGGAAVGYYARGGGVWGAHPLRHWGKKDPEAVRFFAEHAWLLGTGRPADFTFPFWVVIAGAAVATVCGLLILAAYARWQRNARAANAYNTTCSDPTRGVQV